MTQLKSATFPDIVIHSCECTGVRAWFGPSDHIPAVCRICNKSITTILKACGPKDAAAELERIGFSRYRSIAEPGSTEEFLEHVSDAVDTWHRPATTQGQPEESVVLTEASISTKDSTGREIRNGFKDKT